MRIRFFWPHFLSAPWRWFSRPKPALLSAPEAEDQPPLQLTEGDPAEDLKLVPVSQTVKADVAETSSEPILLPAAEVEVLPPPQEQPSPDVSPPQTPIIEVTPEPSNSDTNQAALGSVTPRAPSEEWIRSRMLYFSAGAYIRSSGVERVLAPDLLSRLGGGPQRTIAESPAQTRMQQPAPPPQSLVRSPLNLFATADAAPAGEPGVITSIDPLDFSLFVLNREGGPGVPDEATKAYLTEPALLEQARELRRRVLAHWESGGPPLTPPELYGMAQPVASHSGTALILCHNVAKAFARGGDAICWRLINRTQGEYTDGERSYTASSSQRGALLKTGPFAHRSIFYTVFSAKEFGTADPADYSRFFAWAAITWFAASAAVRPASNSSSAEVTETLLSHANRIRDPEVQLTPTYRGWLWASSMQALDPSPAALGSGARFGLSQAGTQKTEAWGWCGQAETAVAPARITARTLGQILDMPSAHIRRDFQGRSFYLICAVEEGIAARFASADWTDRTLEPLAATLVDEIGWLTLNHAPNRQAVVRCTIPGDDPNKAQCAIDTGAGFRPVEVAT